MKLIVETVAGSRLYGTAREDSDYDYRGVCFAPLDAIIGPVNFKQYEDPTQDRVIYELHKFINLALVCNPNILDILFCPSDKWITSSYAWETIYANRKLFLSSRVVHTYTGYAKSQLYRMERHKRWLENPPTQPDIESYTEKRKGGGLKYKSDADKAVYNALKSDWDKYTEWQANRNPARAALEAQYGYDTKHAAHLARLVVQAQDILAYEDFNPELKEIDLEFVLGVLHGEVAYNDLVEWAGEQFQYIQTMPTKLPKLPDAKTVHAISKKLYTDYLREVL